MASFLKIKQETEKIMKQCAELAEHWGYEISAENIRDYVNALGHKELMVVVAGEARRGKSSLLNALLNEKDYIFPVDINVCTNVVTVARYGEKEKIEVWLADAKAENGYRIESITRSQIVDYVSEKGNPNNYKNVKMLYVAIPNDLLKEGVVFVDTPGVGSLNVEHAETTYGFLPNADILLFVTDADSGLSESELKFLKRGYSYCQSVIFPLTKKDLNADYPIIMEDNRGKISDLLNIPAEKVQIIPVSSKAKLRYLETGRKAMYENSNYAELESAMWATVTKRKGEVLLLPFIESVRNEVLNIQDNLATQYQTIGSSVAVELQEELDKELQKIEELEDNGVNWKTDLTMFFNDLGSDVSVKLQDMDQAAKSTVDHMIATLNTKICNERNYNELLGKVNDIIIASFLDIRKMVEDDVKDKMDDLERQLQMNVKITDILERMTFQPNPTVEVTFPKKNKDYLKTIRIVSMDAGVATTVGATIGCIIGTLIAPGGGTAIGGEIGAEIGASIGAVIGTVHGSRSAFAKYDQVDVNVVKNTMYQHISLAKGTMSRLFNNVQMQLKVTVSTTFDKQLKKKMQELRETKERIIKNIALAKGEIPKQQEMLKRQNAELKKNLRLFELLEQKITSVGAEDVPDNQNEKKVGTAERKVTQDPSGTPEYHFL